MTKVAIMSCSNFSNKSNCGSKGCLRAYNEKTEMFDRYIGENIELVGFNTCAGCPTQRDYEKILIKVKPLVVDCKTEKIHFSSCMVELCPFVQKFVKAINEAYPEVEIVMGTDAYPDKMAKQVE